MKENSIRNAVAAASVPAINSDEPTRGMQFKVVERRLNRQCITQGLERPSVQEVVKALTIGVEFLDAASNAWIAVLAQEQPEVTGGLVKKLSRTVDRRTRNPKTSRGTIYRRNSTVKESRRQNPKWKSGSTAGLELLRRTSVALQPLEDWRLAQQRNEEEKQERRRQEIVKKQTARALNLRESAVGKAMTVFAESAQRKGIVNKPELIARVTASIENATPLPVIIIWGPPYEKQANLFNGNTPESQTISQVKSWLASIRQVVAIEPLLICADWYGTAINGLSKDEVSAYFAQISEKICDVATPVSWSSLKQENRAAYERLRAQVLPNLIVSQKLINNAQIVQRKLGNTVNSSEAAKLAQAYALERTIEGELLAGSFVANSQKISGAIKLATAPSKQNDDQFEPNLPRVYTKTIATRAPWNTPR